MITDDRYAELSAGFDSANARFNRQAKLDMQTTKDTKAMTTALRKALSKEFTDMNINTLRQECSRLESINDKSNFLETVYAIADLICLSRDQDIERT